MSELLKPPGGDWAVLTPVVHKGKCVGAFPRAVLAIELGPTGVEAWHTAHGRHLAEFAVVFTPEGVIEGPDDEWETLEDYVASVTRSIH